MANNSKIQEYKNGQLVVTIPRAIAQAMRLEKGATIEWLFDRGDVIVRKL